MGLNDAGVAVDGSVGVPVGGPVGGAVGGPVGPIAADDTFAIAGRKAMGVHAARLLRFEASLADPTKGDDLKRYRVATRRLRAALRLFGPAYPGRRARSLRDALGELGRAAGAVRDADVRLAGLERWTAGHEGDRTGLAPVREAWSADRERGSIALLARLETKPHRRLRRDLLQLLADDGATTREGARAVRDAAASRIWRSHETLRGAGAAVDWADQEAVHEIRIDAKRLRYSLELLGDVLPAARLELIEQLVALQDHLGAINDAAVTAAAIRSVLAEPADAMSDEERRAIGTYADGRERDIERLGLETERLWRPIASAAFARRLGRAVVIG